VKDSAAEIDRALDGAARAARAWRGIASEQRAAWLDVCAREALAVGSEWAARSCAAKGIDPRSRLAGEPWLSGPMVLLRHLRLYAATLRSPSPFPPSLFRETGNGDQLAATVFPHDPWDPLLYPGTRAEVWIQPGWPATQGGRGSGGVCAVLGAGNINSIPALDALWQLLAEDRVVVVKLNPVNAYMRPLLERIFAPFLRHHFLAFLEGGAAEGESLCMDPRVDAVHLTGSQHSYDTILWGADPSERARRKGEGRPRLTKPVSAELGCVTPVLVVPGPWSRSDLRFQARHIAGMVDHNAGFNCNAAKLIVTARGWPQRESFLRELRAALAALPERREWYPGTLEERREFVAGNPHCERIEGFSGIFVQETGRSHPALGVREVFGRVVGEWAVEAEDGEGFLEEGVRFVNEEVWGSLSCVVLVQPTVDKGLVERAVRRLRYGGIGVNAWGGMLFALGNTTWGAFPGHPPEDIRSGCGVVHNTFLFDHPEKSVLYAPFRPWWKPVYFPGHRTLHRLGPKLCRFEAAPAWWRLPGLAASALLG